VNKRIWIFLLLLAVTVMPVSAIQLEDAFCRGGQTFIQWSDPGTSYIHYHIYRHSEEITQANIQSAELIDPDALLHSAKDLTASYIASRKGLADPNIGLRISDLGLPLDPADCLKVLTVQSNSPKYYAVLGVNADESEDQGIVLGANSLVTPVEEHVGPPLPVLEEQGIITAYGRDYPWKTYTWFRRSGEAARDGEPTKVTVTFPSGMDISKKYRTMLFLHHIGWINEKVSAWDTLVVSPCDFTSGLPNSHNSWWYGYCDGYPNITSGTVVNYSEVMLLHMLDWAKLSFSIDHNRVFLQGGSMGGTGAVSFGLRHPELFAGIIATVPQVNPGLPGIGWSQEQVASIWGSVANNLPTNEVAGVWDRQNMTAYVAAKKADLPFVKVQNSKNDSVLLWFQIPDFYKTLNASRHGFISAWGQGGHVNSSQGLPPDYLGFNPYDKIWLNKSYPAISNSSMNDDPGNGSPASGDGVGQMNAGYDWEIITDTPEEWSAEIWSTEAATADITPRRLQQFMITPGDRIGWMLKDETSQVVKFGNVHAFDVGNGIGRVTLSRLPLNGSHKTLTMFHNIMGTGGVRNVQIDSEVNIKLAVISAVFPDCAYAQDDERTTGVKLLGTTGLAEGDLINLVGVKTDDGEVTVSEAQILGHGFAIAPLGICRFRMTGANAQGLLVKAWGKITRAEGGYLLDNGVQRVFVSGETGQLQEGSLVSVTGVRTTKVLAGETLPAIRVRNQTDITVW